MYDVRTWGQTVLSLHLELILQSSSCGTCLEFLVLVDEVSTPVCYLKASGCFLPSLPF